MFALFTYTRQINNVSMEVEPKIMDKLSQHVKPIFELCLVEVFISSV